MSTSSFSKQQLALKIEINQDVNSRFDKDKPAIADTIELVSKEKEGNKPKTTALTILIDVDLDLKADKRESLEELVTDFQVDKTIDINIVILISPEFSILHLLDQ